MAHEAGAQRGELQLIFDALRRPAALEPRDGILVNTALGWELVFLGDLEATREAVHVALSVNEEHPCEWEHLNLVFSHAVMAKTTGPEEAARSLAAAAKVLVARRPTVGSFVLSGFAYIAHVRGDEVRAREITSMTVPSHGEQLWNWLVLEPLGATSKNFDDARASYETEHPLAERSALDAQHGHRLLDQELERWS